MGQRRDCLPFFLFFVVVIFFSVAAGAVATAPLSRRSFPPGFLFGTASAAYQYEGAAAEGGREPSIWDTFTAQHPEKIKDRSSGRVATDFYHRYKEDVNNMKYLGMDAFRFSISWSRILPNGSMSGGVNKEGIGYYNSIIDELLSKGLQPFVTLFHWDTPQGLEDLYGGFLSTNIVKDYVDYAELCFREFGDRVKHWITFNEPWTFCSGGYAAGNSAPGRCTRSPWTGAECIPGDSGREPYTVGHHQLLAHAGAVKLYRNKYKESQKGVIGITINTNWFLPFKKTKSHYDAAQRALDFMYGWLMDPLTQGDYPFSMRAILGDRLPTFTEQQSNLVKGSFDFIGLNYYSTYYAAPQLFTSSSRNRSFSTDSAANTAEVKSTVGASLAAKKTISKSKRTRSRQKKLKAYDLSSFTDVLPDVNVPTPQPDVTNLKWNCKSRKKLVEREDKQLKAVLSHPAFQSDPISAIRQHLERTQPPSIGLLQSRKDKKSTKKKQRSSSDSMEI